jgi:hypothetical protein
VPTQSDPPVPTPTAGPRINRFSKEFDDDDWDGSGAAHQAAGVEGRAHYREIRTAHLREFFAEDPDRGERLTAEAAGVYLDYSKNRVTDETPKLLLELAEQSGLRERIDAMFGGEKINVTEDRAVLHVALRARKGTTIRVDGEDVVPQVHAVLDKMARFADRVRPEEWTGHTGKPIRNVINIGSGGSDLGPVMAYEALKHYSDRHLTCRFVSNVDGTDFAEATRDVDPAETLFIVSSKTFTTPETMANTAARGASKPWATRRRSPSISSPCRSTRKKSPSSALTRLTCSASGTGSAAGIRWIRPSGSRP